MDAHHRKVASMRSYQAHQELTHVQKHYDKQKIHTDNKLSIEEKQLKKSLERLNKLKHENERRGSCLATDEYENLPSKSSKHLARPKNSNHSPKPRGSIHGDTNVKSSHHDVKSRTFSTSKEGLRKKKGVPVKLQPGKIDTECVSPPSSHDVAVRMLFDKKGQSGSRRKQTLKKSNHGLDVNDLPFKSKSHKEASVRLPVIDNNMRRKSIGNDQINLKQFSKEKIHDSGKNTPGSSSSSINTELGKKLATNKHIYDVVRICMNPQIVVLSPEEEKALKNHQASSSSGNVAYVDNLRMSMKTPTPDNWNRGPPASPSNAWEKKPGFENELFEEIERVAKANKAKLPELHRGPGSKPSLEEASKFKRKSSLHSPHSPERVRRASMDYGKMDFMERQHSFAPQTERRHSFVPDMMRKAPEKDSFHHISRRRESIDNAHRGSGTGSKFDISLLDHLDKKVDSDVLEHYYELLALNKNLLFEDDHTFELPDSDKHIPYCTLKRSQRRKTLALEELLKSLPSYKNTSEMNPKEMLDTRYLRLTPSNIEELEDACRYEGVDPGIHAHMTPKQVEEYFDNMENPLSQADSISEVELVG